ncbi:MAG: hypothetical protein OHK003_18570 [Anaerolineales bacterium]
MKKTKQASGNYLNEINQCPPATGYTKKYYLALSESGLGSEKTLDLFLERYGNHMPASDG